MFGSRLFYFVLTSFVTPTMASAALVYSFGQSNYTVAPGETVIVDVFLQQTDTTTILTDEGLIGGGVRVFFDDSAPTEPAQVLSKTDIIPNPAFDDTFLGADLILDAGVSAGFEDSIHDTLSPLVGSRILLGSFVFTAGTIGGEVTNLTATDLRTGDQNVAGDFTGLDSMISNGAATITVDATAVPEPGSFALISVLGIVSMAVRSRRRRHLKV